MAWQRLNTRKKRDYSHPSIVALIEAAGGARDPEEIVREKCREIVASAIQDGWEGPPFSPFILASLLGVKIRRVTHDIGSEARIYGTRHEVIIEYREELSSPERLPFTICHELVHTVFPDCYERIRRSGGDVESAAEKEFELLCDVGASELLFPLESFSNDISGRRVTLADLRELRETYQASIEATTKRCLDLTDHQMAAVFFSDTNQLGNKLSVRYYWKSRSFRHFIPPGSIPPSKSVVCSVFNGEISSSKQETWCCNGRTLDFTVEAVPLNSVPLKPDYPKIMALVIPA